MQVASVVWGRGALIASALAGVLTYVAARDDARSMTTRGELQAAVSADGFLIAQQISGGRRVWAIGRDGTHHHLAEVVRDGDVRVVGTSAGPAAGYQDGKRIRLSRVGDGADLGMWGTSVRSLCDGVASNDHRFAVGWLEGDGRVWFVHGPTKRGRQATVAMDLDVLDVDIAGQPSWCGLASAQDKVALFWRDRDRLLFNLCTAKRCSGLASSVPFPKNNVVLGMGCVRNACVIAHRDQRGNAAVTYVTESGSAKWSKPIETNATSVSVVGAGDRAFAVGFANDAGTHVLRFDRNGTSEQRWRGSVGSGVPQLVWSAGYLLVASYTNDTVTPISLAFPN